MGFNHGGNKSISKLNHLDEVKGNGKKISYHLEEQRTSSEQTHLNERREIWERNTFNLLTVDKTLQAPYWGKKERRGFNRYA